MDNTIKKMENDIYAMTIVKNGENSFLIKLIKNENIVFTINSNSIISLKELIRKFEINNA